MNNAAQTVEPTEVIVMLTLQFRAGVSSSVIDKMVLAVRLTRLEPGNIDFQFFKVKEKPDSVVIYERWKDQAALEWHWKQPYTLEVLNLFEANLAKPLSQSEDVVYLDDLMKQGK